METNGMKLEYVLPDYKVDTSSNDELESISRISNLRSRHKNNQEKDPLETPMKPFQCKLCPRSYFHITNLYGHMQRKHPNHQRGKKMHSLIQEKEICVHCPLCPQSFPRRKPTQFINHLEDDHKANNSLPEEKDGTFNCPLCPKSFTVKQALHSHVFNIHVEHKPFKCQICKRRNKCSSFVDKKSLDQHTTRFHGPPRFKCEICLTKFADSSNLKRHRNTHLGVPESPEKSNEQIVMNKKKNSKRKTYTCELCENFYASLQALQRHVVNVHVVDKSVECQVCGKMFLDENDLERHVKNTHKVKPKDFTCDVCFGKFNTKESFVLHLGVKHGRFFDCDECSKSFRTKADFDRHSAIVSDSPELQCHVCRMILQNQCSFSIHTKTHAKIKSSVKEDKVRKEKSLGGEKLPQAFNSKGKGFKCDVCFKAFGQLSHVSEHMKQVHPGFKFQCKSCPKMFPIRSQLAKHERRIHSPVRPFECQVCQKTFTIPQGLFWHKKSHEQVKPHKCLICHKSFISPFALRLHMANYHGGEKPFKCHLCDKSWAIKYLLKRHLLSHSKESFFCCDKCSKNFRDSSALKRHQRNFHTKATKQETLDWNVETIELDDRTFACSLCDFETHDEKEIAVHNNQHGNPRVLLSKTKFLHTFPSDVFLF